MVRVLIIGLGSIGTRHCNIIKEFFSGEVEVAGLRSGKDKPKVCDEEFYSYKEAEELFSPEIVIISTPTNLHYASIIKSIETFKNLKGMFIEKPVVHDTKLCGDLVKQLGEIVSHVAAPLRFHPVALKMKSMIKNRELFPRVIRVFSSSYLPSWRKNVVDYSKHYSAIKERGGGVVFELIHELDLIRWIFGEIKNGAFFSGHISSLNIKAEDIGSGIIEMENGTLVEYHVDFFGRVPVRKIEVLSEFNYSIFDLLNSKVEIIGEKEHYSFSWNFERDDMHAQEFHYFLDIVENQSESFNNVKYACKTLEIADFIRNSNKVKILEGSV